MQSEDQFDWIRGFLKNLSRTYAGSFVVEKEIIAMRSRANLPPEPWRLKSEREFPFIPTALRKMRGDIRVSDICFGATLLLTRTSRYQLN